MREFIRKEGSQNIYLENEIKDFAGNTHRISVRELNYNDCTSVCVMVESEEFPDMADLSFGDAENCRLLARFLIRAAEEIEKQQ